MRYFNETKFEVWANCMTLGYFDTLEEAVENAPALINAYKEYRCKNYTPEEIEEFEEELEEEYPRIYVTRFDENGYYGNADKMFTINGELECDWTVKPSWA